MKKLFKGQMGQLNLRKGKTISKIVFSFLLFALFVDHLLIKLSNLKVGCWINRNNFKDLMYADDLILLSISIYELQI